MKYRVWSILALTGLALAGCGHSTGSTQATATSAPPTGNDQAQVAGVLAENPDYVNEDLYQSPLAQPYDQASGFAAIQPLNFWRVITNVQTSFDTQFGPPDSTGRPTSALVTIHRHLTGTFDIAAGSTTPGDTTRSLVQKPLDDAWTRRIALERVPDRMNPLNPTFSRWRLVGTSGVDVRTKGGVTQVQSLHISAGDLDTTVTDPLELHRLRRLFLLPAGSEVTLTATTGNASDVVLFYGHDMRRRFTNNGDGTFTFHFTAGRFLGLRNFGVDALSHGTLFDDSAPYDSNAWIFTFVVMPDRAPIVP
jgi:hypothetical protein